MLFWCFFCEARSVRRTHEDTHFVTASELRVEPKLRPSLSSRLKLHQPNLKNCSKLNGARFQVVSSHARTSREAAPRSPPGVETSSVKSHSIDGGSDPRGRPGLLISRSSSQDIKRSIHVENNHLNFNLKLKSSSLNPGPSNCHKNFDSSWSLLKQCSSRKTPRKQSIRSETD